MVHRGSPAYTLRRELSGISPRAPELFALSARFFLYRLCFSPCGSIRIILLQHPPSPIAFPSLATLPHLSVHPPPFTVHRPLRSLFFVQPPFLRARHGTRNFFSSTNTRFDYHRVRSGDTRRYESTRVIRCASFFLRVDDPSEQRTRERDGTHRSNLASRSPFSPYPPPLALSFPFFRASTTFECWDHGRGATSCTDVSFAVSFSPDADTSRTPPSCPSCPVFDPAGRYLATGHPGGPLTRHDRPWDARRTAVIKKTTMNVWRDARGRATEREAGEMFSCNST